MIDCPNCGTANPADSNFCANCGADLTTVARPAGQSQPFAPPPTEPPVYQSQFQPQPQAAPPVFNSNWTMSDPGPLPERKRRPTWLWIVLGIIGACLLICCAFLIFASTDRGERFFNDLGTRVSEEATRQTD